VFGGARGCARRRRATVTRRARCLAALVLAPVPDELLERFPERVGGAEHAAGIARHLYRLLVRPACHEPVPLLARSQGGMGEILPRAQSRRRRLRAARRAHSGPLHLARSAGTVLSLVEEARLSSRNPPPERLAMSTTSRCRRRAVSSSWIPLRHLAVQFLDDPAAPRRSRIPPWRRVRAGGRRANRRSHALAWSTAHLARAILRDPTTPAS